MFKVAVRLPLLPLSVTVYSLAPMACTYTTLKTKFSMLSFERYQFEYSSFFPTAFGGFYLLANSNKSANAIHVLDWSSTPFG
jgi:hypothetical protein